MAAAPWLRRPGREAIQRRSLRPARLPDVLVLAQLQLFPSPLTTLFPAGECCADQVDRCVSLGELFGAAGTHRTGLFSSHGSSPVNSDHIRGTRLSSE